MRVREWLLTALFPHRCCLCDKVIPMGYHLCRECVAKAPYILPPLCLRCGRNEDACICMGHRRAFERCVSPFYYDGVARVGIDRLKNQGYVPQVDGFAKEMAEVVRREYGGVGFHYVTAVPLHHTDERGRGFNQSRLLAEKLAEMIDVPYVPLLEKPYATRPQKTLAARERSGNLLGAFEVTQPARLPDRTVLLVDDIVTTGATLDECAKMLKIYGADAVYGVTAASSLLKNAE